MEDKYTNNKLIYLSENDGLTGIPTRRKFDSIITKEWNISKENKSLISIIIFDIDCFKQYNDNYGHTVRDEFAIVLPDTTMEEATIYGEKFRCIVEELSIPHKFSRVKDCVTVTLGVSSIIPNNENTIAEFIRLADNALYEAKNMGRNQIIGFNS